MILRSFEQLLGRPLLDTTGTPGQQAEALFNAPFVVASHGTEADPILNYGNRKALELWELDWETFTETPSARTAEAVQRDTRQAMLEQVARQGFAEHYSGIRISSTGRRFRILETIIWNLTDEEGRPCGQAATFSRWDYL